MQKFGKWLIHPFILLSLISFRAEATLAGEIKKTKNFKTCSTCLLEVGINYDASVNHLEGEKSQDVNQFSQYLYFRGHTEKLPTWVYDLELNFSDKNKTIGLESQDANDYRLGLGRYFILGPGKDTEGDEFYNPEELPTWSAGFQANFVHSDVFDENVNLDIVLQNRQKFYYTHENARGKKKFNYGDVTTRFGTTIEYERDFSKGTTLYFDTHYRFTDKMKNLDGGKRNILGPRFVVKHFFTDDNKLEDETTVSLQLVAEAQLNDFLGIYEDSAERQIKIRPILGYDRIFNHLGSESDLSSAYFLLNLSFTIAPNSQYGSGRNVGGRYKRP